LPIDVPRRKPPHSFSLFSPRVRLAMYSVPATSRALASNALDEVSSSGCAPNQRTRSAFCKTSNTFFVFEGEADSPEGTARIIKRRNKAPVSHAVKEACAEGHDCRLREITRCFERRVREDTDRHRRPSYGLPQSPRRSGTPLAWCLLRQRYRLHSS